MTVFAIVSIVLRVNAYFVHRLTNSSEKVPPARRHQSGPPHIENNTDPVISKLGPWRFWSLRDDMFVVWEEQPEYRGKFPPVIHLKRPFHKDKQKQAWAFGIHQTSSLSDNGNFLRDCNRKRQAWGEIWSIFGQSQASSALLAGH